MRRAIFPLAAALLSVLTAGLLLWPNPPSRKLVETPNAPDSFSPGASAAAENPTAATPPEKTPPPEARSVPPPYPSHLEDRNPLRDPSVRRELLEHTAAHQRRLYEGLHRPWLDSLGLDPEQERRLIEMLVSHDLRVQDYIIPYHGGRPAGVMADPKKVAELRASIIESLGQNFGLEVAESYRLEFPGPLPQAP